MPRTRVAGRPTSTPSAVATPAASSAATTNGTPCSSSRITVKPETPAKASCASEIWPDVAGHHHDRQRQQGEHHRHDHRLSVPGRDGDQADDGRGRRARCVQAVTWRGRGRRGQPAAEDRRAVRERVAAPHQRADDQRDGNRLLEARGGQPVGDPGHRRLHGVAEDERLQHADADAGGRSDRRTSCSRPSSAAASAGTTSRVVVVGSRPEIGSIRITARPASTDAIAQFTAPSRSGEMPSSSAPFSLPAAARVARPNRVSRYSGGQARGGHHDERDQQQSVLAHRRADQPDRVLGQHRAAAVHPGAGDREPQPHELLEVQQQTERRDHPGQHRRPAQRPEDQPVDGDADRRAEQDRERPARWPASAGPAGGPAPAARGSAAPGRRSHGTRRRRTPRTCPSRRARS